jgi:hypothetical protein
MTPVSQLLTLARQAERSTAPVPYPPDPVPIAHRQRPLHASTSIPKSPHARRMLAAVDA